MYQTQTKPFKFVIWYSLLQYYQDTAAHRLQARRLVISVLQITQQAEEEEAGDDGAGSLEAALTAFNCSRAT